MRLSDWSSELCSSDLSCLLPLVALQQQAWQQITFQRKLRFLLACLVCRQLRLEERRLRNCYLAGRKPPDPSGTRSMITELSEGIFRSEERRVGKEWGSTCKSRWSPFH